MPHDPARISEVREWLKRAELDLRAAEHQFKANPPITPDILSHSQQLAEKSMKAFLAWNDIPFRKAPSLLKLGEQCSRVDPSLEPLLRRSATLTEYAWKFRYPGDVEEPEV